MGCCSTKIVQVAGGAGGGGPFTVAPNTPGAGQTTVTDTTSGNSFVIPAGLNVYNTDDSLTGNRTMNSAGFDFTFNGGGDFIIDGKLTVTGIIDPTGLQFTGGVQADAGMPNGTIFVTDGSASGIPSGEIIFKDFTGNYHRLENVTASGSILLADFVQVANRVQDFAGFAQVWNNMSTFTRNSVDGNEVANFSSALFLGSTNVVTHNVVQSDITITNPLAGTTAKFIVSANPELSYDVGGSKAGYFIKLGGVGAALGVPQLHLTTVGVNSSTATVGQVLTLTNAVSGECEFQDVSSPRGIFVKNTTPGINSPSLQSLPVTATVSWTAIGAGAAVNPGALDYPGVTADISIGASAITIQTPGVYKVDIAVKFWDLAFGNQYFLSAFKNAVNKSVDTFTGRDPDATGAIFTGGRVSFIDSFVAGDTISARVGSTISNTTLEINHVQFDLVRLSA